MSEARAIPVVIRSHNDLSYLKDTLAMVFAQSLAASVHVFDNDSSDGTLDYLASQNVTVHRVPEGTYIPGDVLNRAMQTVDPSQPFVAFLNSDCTPLDEHWLEYLLASFSEGVAAVFGRQVPRPDCKPLFAKDTEDTFGDGERQKTWKHCFSMASSAIRRSVWESMPFRTDITYSEDIDWTWRARQEGWKISYAKDSQVYHSHNYTPSQFYKRHQGEGRAEAHIFTWKAWERSFLRYSLLPFLRQIKSDYIYAIQKGHPSLFVRSPILRLSQLRGRRKGFLQGLKEIIHEQ
ncbi:glycosyltransferase [uncultured Sphaerochaeta sp.]|uniref:glycosyltransferase family 2 protein n=1 Tax=uncultured Sphaerochaeta sp. TaxID=886478 RepID=UPI002AA6E925|nr:glycosyltransferase [uncultured Sphaerochaeta sp.]